MKADITDHQKPTAPQTAGTFLRMAIFASGAGSNAQKIISHFKNSAKANVVLIVVNKPGAGVVSIAGKENIDVLILDRNKFEETGYVQELKNYKIDFIILAGFLWKIPSILINAFSGKMVNIHPALLPAYGGKGMYGNAVHSAVIAAHEKESGITIHYVDEKYDHGEIIFQASCGIDEQETAESLAEKIHQLEHENYPKIIEATLDKITGH